MVYRRQEVKAFDNFEHTILTDGYYYCSYRTTILAIVMKFLKNNYGLYFEIILRVFLLFITWFSNEFQPIFRKILPEELWMYKYPRTESYISANVMWLVSCLVPSLCIFLYYLIRRDKVDAVQASLAASLSIAVTALLTNFIKLAVSRPRPDFFWRCFPDGIEKEALSCTGNSHTINEGLKSFPSGHSATSFSGFGFTAFYLAGKIHCFCYRNPNRGWRLCVFLFPLTLASLIAISRTIDHHHHPQDVLVGSILGLVLSYVSYRQYYPPLNEANCHSPYASIVASLGATRDSEMNNLQVIKTI